MTNFKVGQKVVCIKKDGWRCERAIYNYGSYRNPKYNEICTISGYDEGFLMLKEYGELNLYHLSNFRPIAEYADATSEILSKFKPTEDTPDVEIKKHELTT